MELAMNLTEEHLRQIGSYIKQNFDEISSQSRFVQERSYEIQIIERITRVEEELKSQRDLLLKQHEMMMFGFAQMEKRFEQFDKRFEMTQKNMDDRFSAMQRNMDDRFAQVDKRFDDVNKRFTMLMWAMGIGFTLTTTALSLITIFVK